MHKDKRFYNRVTIAALDYEILQMSFKPPSMELKLLTLFLIQGTLPILIQCRDFHLMMESL